MPELICENQPCRQGRSALSAGNIPKNAGNNPQSHNLKKFQNHGIIAI